MLIGVAGSESIFPVLGLAMQVGDCHDHDLIAADLVEEIHVPGAAAKLAVGDALEPDLLLHPDYFANGFVLDAAQLRGRQAAGLML